MSGSFLPESMSAPERLGSRERKAPKARAELGKAVRVRYYGHPNGGKLGEVESRALRYQVTDECLVSITQRSGP